MPSKRSSAIIGIWVILAVLMIADFALFQSRLLDNLYSGLNGLVNVLIIAFLPIIGASLLLDRRAQPVEAAEPQSRLPRGTRSASGQPLGRARPTPRIKRDKRAAELETIVVEPTAASSSIVSGIIAASPSSSAANRESSSSQFIRSQRPSETENEELDQQVKDQLDAIELEMAKLEEQLEQNGITSASPNSKTESAPEIPNTVTDSQVETRQSSSGRISSEEASSELQAIDELLARLEQRKRAGGVDEDTYLRLREKYLKRRAEL